MKDLPITYSGTILSDEINSRLRGYIEPKRPGIKKGEKIGHSKIKYMAALILGATNFSQKELAELLGISYSSLRQWNMEADFRATKNHVLGCIAIELTNYFGKHRSVRKDKKISDAEIYNDGIFTMLIDLLFQNYKGDKMFLQQMPNILIESFGVKRFEEERALHVEKLILRIYLQTAKKYNFIDKEMLNYIERYQKLIAE